MANKANVRWTVGTARVGLALAVVLVIGAVACSSVGGAASSGGDPDQNLPAPQASGQETIGQGGEEGGDPGGAGQGGAGQGGAGQSSGGQGDGGSGGGDSVEDPAPVEPAPKDCIPYDPANLTVADAGATGWYVRDGSRTMMVFDTKAHADDAVKVARKYTRSCYVGRGNTRPERSRYIVQYWEGPSGLPAGLAPALDCSGYNPATLAVVSAGGSGWRLSDGTHEILLLDTAADAERAKIVAGGATKLCLIGASNSRPDWHRYTMEYWL